MKRFHLILAASLCLFVSATAQEEKPQPVILNLGDSITKGVRGGVTAGQTFSAILEKRLSVPILNVGIGGERTDQALQRLEKAVIGQRPRIVPIMYGTNDSYIDTGKKGSRITKIAYEENLRSLIEKLLLEGIEPVLMTEPRWASNKENWKGESPNRCSEFLSKSAARSPNLRTCS